ncbi:unnamed protein product [Phytomonas sp. EM1]|nr:unnamed protein product [Phytomonas sp. EM1]|eukprot:CCW61286.1 unnamed protein product [Phytomonas sp. isolate EM1]
MEPEAREGEGGETARRHLWELIKYHPDDGVENGEERGNLVAAACATLVNFFHSLNDLPTASAIAEMVIAEGGELSKEDRIDFLKVCALHALSNTVESGDSSLIATATLLTRRILPILKERPVMTPAEYFWWCRFLFFISESISEVEVDVGIEIGCAAVELFRFSCDASLEENKKMLHDQTFLILHREFDLFVYGMPKLSVETIASYLSLVQEGSHAEEDEAADVVTVLLSRVELHLRGLSPEAAIAEVEAAVNLTTLIAAGASHYDLEALAGAITFIGNQLGNEVVLQYAVTVQLAAAAQFGASLEKGPLDPAAPSPMASRTLLTPDALASLLILYYKAYQMAMDPAQREEVLKVVQEKVLGNLSPAQTMREYLARLTDDEEATGDVMSEKIETLLEYFAIEAWNKAVRFNATHNREQMLCWRNFAETFSRVLSMENPARIAITDLSSRMPEM